MDLCSSNGRTVSRTDKLDEKWCSLSISTLLMYESDRGIVFFQWTDRFVYEQARRKVVFIIDIRLFKNASLYFQKKKAFLNIKEDLRKSVEQPEAEITFP